LAPSPGQVDDDADLDDFEFAGLHLTQLEVQVRPAPLLAHLAAALLVQA
jgi:hypothetical protein